MKRLTPRAWLVIQGVAFALALLVLGKLSLVKTPDAATYLEVELGSPSRALAEIRTVLYPALLAVVRPISPSYAVLPFVQLAIHLGAVAGFYACLSRALPSPWSALALSSPLLWSKLAFRYTSHMLADVLATSLAIATVGMLVLLARRFSWRLVAGIGAATFLAWQARPVNVFLVPLLPILGSVLAGLFGEPRRRPALALLAVTAVPLLAFCSARASVTGHFGVTSLNGHSLVGIAGQLLEPSSVEELPEDVRPLARAIVARRVGVAGIESAVNADGQLEFTSIDRSYNPIVWTVAVPAARELVGDDPASVDRALQRLSVEVVKKRPGLYARWLAKAFRAGLALLASDNPTLLATVALFLAAHVLVRRGGARPFALELDVALAVAGSFALANLAMVILVQVPITRYMDGAGVFLPLIPAVGVLDRLARRAVAT